jgi:hypothetical protein
MSKSKCLVKEKNVRASKYRKDDVIVNNKS